MHALSLVQLKGLGALPFLSPPNIRVCLKEQNRTESCMLLVKVLFGVWYTVLFLKSTLFIFQRSKRFGYELNTYPLMGNDGFTTHTSEHLQCLEVKQSISSWTIMGLNKKFSRLPVHGQLWVWKKNMKPSTSWWKMIGFPVPSVPSVVKVNSKQSTSWWKRMGLPLQSTPRVLPLISSSLNLLTIHVKMVKFRRKCHAEEKSSALLFSKS